MLSLRAKSASSDMTPLQTTAFQRVTVPKTTAFQVLYAVTGFLQSLCSEFAELINAGDAKGWIRYLKAKHLSDELYLGMEDGWLNLSVKMTLVSDEEFGNMLPPVLRRLPMHRLPKVDSGAEIRHQGVHRFPRTPNTLITL